MKIICSGPNYKSHFDHLPENLVPQFFLKTPNSLVNNGSVIPLPSYATETKIEVELAFEIGKNIHNVNMEEAIESISGYAVALDLTVKNVIPQDIQWVRAKAFDGSCPISNFEEFSPSNEVILTAFKNDKKIQEFSLEGMIFSPAQLIVYLSKFMSLQKGDIILTGSDKSSFHISEGDKIKASIDGLNSLNIEIGSPLR